MRSIPPSLAQGPFTTAQAREAGLPDDALRGRRFRRLFRGVHILASLELTLTIWLAAALLVLPRDAVVSHLTALRLYGFELGAPWPLHFSTNTPTHSRHSGLEVHRRRGRLHPHIVSGLPVAGPDRTLVDIATKVGLVELIQAIEWMLHAKLTTPERLADYAMAQHLDGVRRIRRVLGLVREGVESPMETVLRLMIVCARLPEPTCNADIIDTTGRFIARGDLVFRSFMVLVEYDGWQHERDGRQRQRDRERREQLEAAGWRVIVVTSTDMQDKREVVHRVHSALLLRDYTGPAPVFSIMWTRWFA